MAGIPKRGIVEGEERGDSLPSVLCASVLFEFFFFFGNEHFYYHFENEKYYVHQEDGIGFKLWYLQDCYSLYQRKLGLFVKMKLSEAGYIFNLWLLFPWIQPACLKIHMFSYML